jgi:hypothetical protein
MWVAGTVVAELVLGAIFEFFRGIRGSRNAIAPGTCPKCRKRKATLTPPRIFGHPTLCDHCAARIYRSHRAGAWFFLALAWFFVVSLALLVMLDVKDGGCFDWTVLMILPVGAGPCLGIYLAIRRFGLGPSQPLSD